jgi:NADH-quinone oxidoreductase subunit A
MLVAFSVVLVFIIFSLLFVAGAMLISSFLRPKTPSKEKSMTYECGEDPVGGGWVQYNIRFYVIAVIFIIFDVEVVFIYPVAKVFREMIDQGLGAYVLAELLVFVLILFGGLIYVWKKGDLQWIKTLRHIKGE